MRAQEGAEAAPAKTRGLGCGRPPHQSTTSAVQRGATAAGGLDRRRPVRSACRPQPSQTGTSSWGSSRGRRRGESSPARRRRASAPRPAAAPSGSSSRTARRRAVARGGEDLVREVAADGAARGGERDGAAGDDGQAGGAAEAADQTAAVEADGRVGAFVGVAAGRAGRRGERPQAGARRLCRAPPSPPRLGERRAGAGRHDDRRPPHHVGEEVAQEGDVELGPWRVGQRSAERPQPGRSGASSCSRRARSSGRALPLRARRAPARASGRARRASPRRRRSAGSRTSGARATSSAGGAPSRRRQRRRRAAGATAAARRRGPATQRQAPNRRPRGKASSPAFRSVHRRWRISRRSGDGKLSVYNDFDPHGRRRLPIVRLGNPILRKRSRPFAGRARSQGRPDFDRTDARHHGARRRSGAGGASGGRRNPTFSLGRRTRHSAAGRGQPQTDPSFDGDRRGLGGLPLYPRAPWARATSPRRAAHRRSIGTAGRWI